MEEMRPVVVDDECKKIKCDCLVKEDERNEHREMEIDHQNLVKLVMDTKQSMKENQDNKAFHGMLSQLPKGCVAKMNDLGEKLGCLDKSQVSIDCHFFLHFFQRCVLVCPMS